MRNSKIGFSSIGRWWHRNEEIDIVVLCEENKEVYFGEVKWSRKPFDMNNLDWR